MVAVGKQEGRKNYATSDTSQGPLLLLLKPKRYFLLSSLYKKFLLM